MRNIITLTFIVLFASVYVMGQTTETFTTPGSGSWVCPAGITSIDVECWGAGGGGGSSNNTTAKGGSGGGGGSYCKSTFSVTPGTTYYFFIGTGGTGAPASSTSPATAGGQTWFNTTNSAPTSNAGVLAGGGGLGGNDGGTVGAGGTATYYTTTGTNGTAGSVGVNAGGGNGGAGANGGAGGVFSSGNGTVGTAPGGGGSGSDDVATTKGGNGANGQVVITKYCGTISSFPWSENFDAMGSIGNSIIPSCWKIESGSGTPWASGNSSSFSYNDPYSSPYYIGCYYSPSSTDKYLISPGFSLTSGTTYTFSFKYAGDGYSGWTGDVRYNTSQTGSGSTMIGSAFITSGTTSSTSYTTVTRNFTAPSTGTYYFMVHINNSLTPWGYMGLDDFSFVIPPNMTYTSSTTTQSVTSNVSPGSTNQQILGVQVVTTNAGSPLNISSLSFNTTGTTAPTTDISNAKVWYTGTSSTFATSTQYGTTTAAPNGAFTISGTQALSEGTNYFWLTYDIPSGATENNVVDAQCTSINVGGAQTPTVTDPSGTRTIVNEVTIGTGTSTTYYSPSYTYYAYSRSATIYTAAEIGATPTLIKTLAWNIEQATTDNVPFKIYLKTTTASSVTSDTWANLVAGATLVYDGTVQFTPTGWKTFDITDFSYCGDNLMILCESNMSSSPYNYTYFYYTTTSPTYQTQYWSGSSVPTGTGSTTYYRPNIKITKGTTSSMSFVSSTATQNNTSAVNLGTTSQEVIGMQVVTTGCASALTASSFTINITGTTSSSDISNLKLWTSGTSSSFATSTQLGATVASPSGSHVITGGSNMPYTLSSGTNYFWVTYDVAGGATTGNKIDAECTSITVGGTPRTPTTTAPAGNRTIVNQVTIGAGVSTGSYPFLTNWGYGRSASLYTSAEIGGLPNLITDLSWEISTAQTTTIPVKIYLKTTTATTLTSVTWDAMISGATLVYDGSTQFTPTGWKSFDITDFNYCSDNLLVLCEANYGSSGAGATVSYYYTTTSNCHETWSADNSPPSGSGSVGSSRPNIKISKQTVGSMTFVSSTSTQSNTSNVANGTTNQEILGIQVVTTGCSSALTASSFTINITGTTLATDITNLKLWSTGNSGTFATTTQLGATVAAPSGVHTISSGSNMPVTLTGGTNYFWVSYDIPTAATHNNIIDAECTALTVGGIGRTPTTTNPSGSRTIVVPVPSCATYTAPADAQTQVDYTSGTTLTWNSVATATQYKVYLGTDNPPTNKVNGTSQAGLIPLAIIY